MEFKLVPGENDAAEGWATATIPMKVYMEAIKNKTPAERMHFWRLGCKQTPALSAGNQSESFTPRLATE